MGIRYDPDPDSDPETDLSACPHRQINPNNSNFHESGILYLFHVSYDFDRIAHVLSECCND